MQLCGRKEQEVKCLVADPRSQAYICDSCAEGIAADLKRIEEQRLQAAQEEQD